MARPSSIDMEAALDTARDEIWRNGYEAVSVKALSEKLGITRSSYYNAFGSREELFKTILMRYHESTPAYELTNATPDMSARTLISGLIIGLCELRAADAEKRGCLAVNSIAELLPGEEELGPFLTQGVIDTIAKIEEILTWGVENGELPADIDVKGTALAVQNLVIGLNMMSKIDNKIENLWTIGRLTLSGLGLLDPKITLPRC